MSYEPWGANPQRLQATVDRRRDALRGAKRVHPDSDPGSIPEEKTAEAFRLATTTKRVVIFARCDGWPSTIR